ncbi:MAG: AzlC family ABC transporter permease [Betaproteobacteria bacterium]|nr:AzlC family ABC transporter permease [Betaproteobacteria bacterium]MBA3775250.1 AzlC family ABC transporter permease [Betaproteobacteria bacterium]
MSRVFSKPDFYSGVRGMLPAAAALIPFGLVCGVGAAAVGAAPLAAIGLSAIVFSGAAQILATQLYAAGAPLAVIVLTCFVIGLRLAMYSAAMAPHLGTFPARWRYLSAFLLTDQAFAATISRFEASADKGRALSHFVGGGTVLWASWQLMTMAGYFLGNVIPPSWSLEFAVPLCFIALLGPLLREKPAIAAAVSAAIAVVLLAGLPMRLNIVVAGVIGIAIGTLAELVLERKTTAREQV